jgi:MoaA/NifB/PqqE/SkfB family radical SAM enzyme/SAM-dependent methyltransferase
MAFRPDLWTRFTFQGTPIYIRGDKPDWFVPNEPGDQILQKLSEQAADCLDIPARRFLARLPDEPVQPYEGRAAYLQTDQLREVWLHITDRCNQACRHCLFACSPQAQQELPGASIRELAVQARDLGCRVFALTGGEPLVHPEFAAIVDFLLADAAAHVVVLSNGTLVRDYAAALRRWPRERFHLQISVDGLGTNHDSMRGRGAFAALQDNLAWLRAQNLAFTLSMCVTADNVADMPGLVDFAAALGATNLHFLWYFRRGRGGAERFVPPADIFPHLTAAALRAKAAGISIDNLEALRSQIFAPSGTKHDGAGSGWESLAVGPDGRLYPSPALVGVAALATELQPDLATAWRRSPVFANLRQASALSLASPWRFLLGGGDPDHSYLSGGDWVGQDPYLPLYEQLALWLIAQEAVSLPGNNGLPGLRLQMGDILKSCGAPGTIALTHSNCLLAAATPDSRIVVQEFYQAAATAPKEEIFNPVCYPAEAISHIPPAYRFRGYGCGSPVLDAALQPGERVLDLGCGAGVECFIAARLVGATGWVVGVDMLEAMLSRAVQGGAGVGRNLGYYNLEFKQGFLEELPLPDADFDVVMSNCVINLSSHKRRTFAEIFRVLKPGGRLVIADVVCETDPALAIKNDPLLQGECIAGALTQRDLFGLLAEAGFVAATVVKRFPYRVVQGHPFFSLTYEARKPAARQMRRVMYRGPFAALVTATGQILPAGVTQEIALEEGQVKADELFVFDQAGAIINKHLTAPSCCPTLAAGCFLPEETSPATSSSSEGAAASGWPSPGSEARLALVRPALALNPTPDFRPETGCLVCGQPVHYRAAEVRQTCAFCGGVFMAPAQCAAGHFVCDACHTRDAEAFLEHICTVTSKTDLVDLLQEIRRHPAIPLHGPEHHLMVPGIILATYRNLGGQVPRTMLQTALRRGKTVPGGYCAYTGGCGAALGVGIAFSLILRASPVKARERQQVQQVTQAVIQAQARFAAARCCQRDSWLALKTAAALSKTYLSISLPADVPLRCQQAHLNQECLGQSCPLWPRS